MNIRLITERLKSLKITYDYEEKGKKTGIFSDGVKGAYLPELNHMYFEGVKDFSEVDLRAFIHEYGHVLQIPSSGDTAEYTDVIFQREVLRRLIDRGEVEAKEEYFDSNGKLTNFGLGYPDYTKKMYLVLKLIKIGERKEYMYQTDENVLAEGLIRIDNQGSQEERENRAYRLIELFEDNDDFDIENLDKSVEESKKRREEFFDLIDYYYYQSEYEKKVTEDLNSIVAFSYKHTFNFGEIEFEFGLTSDIIGASGSDIIKDSFKDTFEDWNYEYDFLNVTGIPENLMFDVSENSVLYYETTDGGVAEYVITDELDDLYRNNFLNNLKEKQREQREQR